MIIRFAAVRGIELGETLAVVGGFGDGVCRVSRLSAWRVFAFCASSERRWRKVCIVRVCDSCLKNIGHNQSFLLNMS